MERVRPYLFWIVLGAVLLALLVVRLGPIQSVYREARTLGSRFDRTRRALQTAIDKGDGLPRPAKVTEIEKLARKYEGILASQKFRTLAIDLDSEFWPADITDKDVYIDFTKPPSDPTELRLRLTNLRIAQQALMTRVGESILYVNADPAQGEHLIRLAGDAGAVAPAHSDLAGVAGVAGLAGETGLAQILATQRILWLRQALHRIVTNPDVDIKAIRAIGCSLPRDGGVGFPTPNPDPPYVTLNWVLEVDVPVAKVPVLLSALALSKRHLQVQDFRLGALPETVIDFRSGDSPRVQQAGQFWAGERVQRGPTERTRREGRERLSAEILHRAIEETRFQTGHLVVLHLTGVSYDFLILPDGHTGWPT